MPTSERILIVAIAIVCATFLNERRTQGANDEPSPCCDNAKKVLSGPQADPVSPNDLSPGKRRLFIDDSVIQDVRNLVRIFYSPTKIGAVVRPDQEWEGNAIQIRSSPIWSNEDQEWKLWYYHFGTDFTGLATSKDGIHWIKPELNVRAYGNSTKNNLISLEPKSSDGAEGIVMNIVYDPDDPDPSRRYKGLAGRDLKRQPVFSSDGIRWHCPDLPGIPSHDESNLYYDGSSKTFVATVKQNGPYGRSVYLSVSKDFQHWTDPRNCLIFHADARDQTLGMDRIKARLQSSTLQLPEYNVPATYNVDVYNMAVVRYQDLYLGFPALFHQVGKIPGSWPGFVGQRVTDGVLKSLQTHGDWTGFHNFELIYSHNLIDWNRTEARTPFLENSPPDPNGNNFDLQTMLATSPVVRNDEIWFYYSGLKHYATLASELNPHDNGAVCLAKLRIDGFASYSGGTTAGTLTTKPVRWLGNTLYLNAVSRGGVRVEILDGEKDSPISGFSAEDANPVRGDSTKLKATWNGADVARLAGTSVRLRFHIEDAELFSFWTE